VRSSRRPVRGGLHPAAGPAPHPRDRRLGPRRARPNGCRRGRPRLPADRRRAADAAGARMKRPAKSNTYNLAIIEEFRATAGRVGGSWTGHMLILLPDIGARSGMERVTPLGCFPQGDGRYVVVASNGGSPANPAWFHNLKAHPRIEVEFDGETFTV